MYKNWPTFIKTLLDAGSYVKNVKYIRVFVFLTALCERYYYLCPYLSGEKNKTKQNLRQWERKHLLQYHTWYLTALIHLFKVYVILVCIMWKTFFRDYFPKPS